MLHVWELYLGWLSSKNVCLSVGTGFVKLKKHFCSGVKVKPEKPHLLDLLLDCLCEAPTGVVCASLASKAV